MPRQFKKLTLRAQTLLVVGAAITILASILFFLSRAIVLRGFAELEVAEVMENVERVRRALGEDLAYMKSIVGDYAPWDATYEFMDDQNDQFVITNFTEGTLANIRIDLMILLDNAHSQVFSRAVDTETEVEGPVADEILQALTAYSRLFKHDDNHSTTTGLAHVPGGIMLVASHPIVKSDWSGPIRGTLVIGRYLSPSEVAK